MIKKIISGGQTGADQGALDFALEHGIPCGGWCPKGRICELGIIPDIYPLHEVELDDYDERTQRNILDSDGTLVIICNGFMEEGTHLTLDFCWEQGRPVIMLDTEEIKKDPVAIRQSFEKWITENKIEVLNVAGNRESNCPGLQKKIPEILALIGQMS